MALANANMAENVNEYEALAEKQRARVQVEKEKLTGAAVLLVAHLSKVPATVPKPKTAAPIAQERKSNRLGQLPKNTYNKPQQAKETCADHDLGVGNNGIDLADNCEANMRLDDEDGRGRCKCLRCVSEDMTINDRLQQSWKSVSS